MPNSKKKKYGIKYWKSVVFEMEIVTFNVSVIDQILFLTTGLIARR